MSNNGILLNSIKNALNKSDSWAEIVDVEISHQVEGKLLTNSSNNSIEKNPRTSDITTNNISYNIADIVAKDPETIDDVKLLEWETYLSSNLKKYIKQCIDTNCDIDYCLHINKFEWLARASKYLSNKLGLVINNHKLNNIEIQRGIIPRSSYKFCEYNYDCQFNYQDKYSGCYAQHFVHNLVCADIYAVINHLKNCYETRKEYNYQELIKCINTISYVVKHMYEELSNLQSQYGNIDNVHIERSKIKKKKSYKKKYN